MFVWSLEEATQAHVPVEAPGTSEAEAITWADVFSALVAESTT